VASCDVAASGNQLVTCRGDGGSVVGRGAEFVAQMGDGHVKETGMWPKWGPCVDLM
jgi:hypothetical protein